MKVKEKVIPIIYAILAALFYALNSPISKILLNYIDSIMLAGLLYLGAGIGIGVLFVFKYKKIDKKELLEKKDHPYVIGMIVLDIIAPILLLMGLKEVNASNAALLNNFEIVATALIALIIFKEMISTRLWVAIAIIAISSGLLSFNDISSFDFSIGSIWVILATICWGFENNCTRKISNKNTYEIVTIKGICCGATSLIISIINGAKFPEHYYVIYALMLGFAAYGLSIFLYIKAQNKLGAAKTSAFYAIAPFISAILALIIFQTPLTIHYGIAFVLMMIGSILVIIDSIQKKHSHVHTHTFTHTHDGTTHTHTITHSHSHIHGIDEEKHGHTHSQEELENTK